MLPNCGRKQKGKALLYTVLCISAFVIAILGLLSLLAWLIFSGKIITLYNWVEDIGVWAYLVLGVLIAIANLPIMVGYDLVLLLSGLFFGFWLGMVTAILGSFCGWFPTFLVLRKVYFERAKKVRFGNKQIILYYYYLQNCNSMYKRVEDILHEGL